MSLVNTGIARYEMGEVLLLAKPPFFSVACIWERGSFDAGCYASYSLLVLRC